MPDLNGTVGGQECTKTKGPLFLVVPQSVHTGAPKVTRAPAMHDVAVA